MWWSRYYPLDMPQKGSLVWRDRIVKTFFCQNFEVRNPELTGTGRKTIRSNIGGLLKQLYSCLGVPTKAPTMFKALSTELQVARNRVAAQMISMHQVLILLNGRLVPSIHFQRQGHVNISPLHPLWWEELYLVSDNTELWRQNISESF